MTAFTSSGIKFKITRPFNLEKDGKDADEVLDKYGSEIMVSKMNDLLDPITYAVLCLDKNKGDYIKISIQSLVDYHLITLIYPSQKKDC